MGKKLEIICDNDILKMGGVHKGYKFYRTKETHSERERAFYKRWKKENKRESWINFGNGVLQDIFAKTGGNPFSMFNFKGWKLVINKRDQYIVATVIQWLGTNCGWCFLQEVLRDCGYEIVKTKQQRDKEHKEMEKRMEKIQSERLEREREFKNSLTHQTKN